MNETKKAKVKKMIFILLVVSVAGLIAARDFRRWPGFMELAKENQQIKAAVANHADTAPNNPATIDYLIGTVKTVAYSNDNERNPSVAFCSDGYYLVVYERAGDIYGRYITWDGSVVGSAFEIYNGTYNAYDPDVACEWDHEAFVVVFTYDYNGDGSDLDVRGQQIDAEMNTGGDYLIGLDFAVSTSGSYSESRPAIDCNTDQHSCLVVFEHSEGSGDIHGQRLAVTSVLGL